MKAISREIAAAMLALVTMACSPYSFSGGRTALVKTITVPTFENQTTEFGLAETITRGVIDGFVEDNQIKVVDPSQAEATLLGTIVEYKRRAYTFDETDRVTEYIVELWVNAELRRAVPDTVLWNVDRLRGFGVYQADSTEQSGQEKAIDKLTEEILNRTIKSW